MLHSVFQGYFSQPFFGEKFTFLLLGFPFSPGDVHYLSFDFPVEICSSLLATQVITPKSAKTTNSNYVALVKKFRTLNLVY